MTRAQMSGMILMVTAHDRAPPGSPSTASSPRWPLAPIAAGPLGSSAWSSKPPWIRQRPFMGLSRCSSHTAGAWHGVPFRVLAPHRGRSDLGTLGSEGENRQSIKSITRARNVPDING
jgi:hypothetical protein